MSVDWSKYPPLPEAPTLPEWRDTPEHEAYWKEVDTIKTPMENGKILWVWFVLWMVFPILLICFFCFGGEAVMASIFAGTIVGYIFASVPLIICHKIFYHIAKRKISRKYGFSLKKLNRPDISKEIGEVLAARPDFDLAEFCKYWQNAGQAISACGILAATKRYWCLHKKMLYPNDPLLLLFYGRHWNVFCKWRWGKGKEKMIEPDIEFYMDCIWCYLDVFDRDRFYEESKIFYSKSTTIAEFLEICEEMKAKEEMSQCSAGKKI